MEKHRSKEYYDAKHTATESGIKVGDAMLMGDLKTNK